MFVANSKNSTHSFDEPFSESLWTLDLSSFASLDLDSFGLDSLSLDFDSLGFDSLGFDSLDLGAATVDIVECDAKSVVSMFPSGVGVGLAYHQFVCSNLPADPKS